MPFLPLPFFHPLLLFTPHCQRVPPPPPACDLSAVTPVLRPPPGVCVSLMPRLGACRAVSSNTLRARREKTMWKKRLGKWRRTGLRCGRHSEEKNPPSLLKRDTLVSFSRTLNTVKAIPISQSTFLNAVLFNAIPPSYTGRGATRFCPACLAAV